MLHETPPHRTPFMRYALCLLAALSAPALAEGVTQDPTLTGGCFGAGEPLFHCTFKGGQKAVDICLQGDVVLYRFGPVNGPAELLLARHVIGVDMTPWSGVGRAIWEELTLHNNVYSYVLSYSVDRIASEEVLPTGGLIVAEGDSELADLSCDPGSVGAADFYPVYEAKEAAGQCYRRETQSWSACE